jgi:redox-sensitive bicupin YhaK (pirin superfamily)
MITLRPSAARGRFDFGWLDTRHTFSFGEYHDPDHMGFRSLRVLNEDRVQPGQGFGTHGHRDMEIVTYVLSGALEHKDSTGTHGIIRPGDAQRMSAGTGIRHSEFNASKSDPVHFLQIWILPAERGIPPGYEQKNAPAAGTPGTAGSRGGSGAWRAIASPDGRDGSVKVRQDALILVAAPGAGEEVTYTIPQGRGVWIQVARGSASLSGGGSSAAGGRESALAAGDGAALEGEPSLSLRAGPEGAEILLFDLS